MKQEGIPLLRTIMVTKVYNDKTVVPSEVRKLLKLKDGNAIVWYEDNLGAIFIKKSEETKEPPRGYTVLPDNNKF